MDGGLITQRVTALLQIIGVATLILMDLQLRCGCFTCETLWMGTDWLHSHSGYCLDRAIRRACTVGHRDRFGRLLDH